MRFRATPEGTSVDLEPFEVEVLQMLMGQLEELLTPPLAEPDVPADPLAELVGLSDSKVERPDDPALIRLFPDAYGDDPEASGDFRRYTDRQLREDKQAHARGLLASLPEGGGTVVLDRDQVDHWLLAVNDARLVLGTRLEVTDDGEPPELTDDDPRAPSYALYEFLGSIQWQLLAVIEPRLPD